MKEIYKAKNNPFEIVRMFEEEVARYAGAPYAVAIDSCTNALFLCCKFVQVKEVIIPSKTYLSVPQAIIQAGGTVKFDSDRNNWEGIYDLDPYQIIDAAKRFTSDMYISGSLMCLSFHSKKILAIGKGGMILTDSPTAYEWLKRARYEGRGEQSYHDDDIIEFGYNMYMTPEQAARGLILMQNIPLYNADQQEECGYRDLTEFSLFKNYAELYSRDMIKV